MLPVSIFMCLVSNVTRVYLSVSCVQCYPCLTFCVLSPMMPMSIFLCLVPNVTRVYLSLSCAQCYPCLSFCVLCPMLPCLSFCVLCPMLPVSIFLCLLSNFSRVYLYVFCVVTLDTRHRKIDMVNIGHKTQKDTNGKHRTQETER
jgi:hypothetical protein